MKTNQDEEPEISNPKIPTKSSSFSSSWGARVMPLLFSPQHFDQPTATQHVDVQQKYFHEAEGEEETINGDEIAMDEVEGLMITFTDIEWKEVEDRFDRVSWTSFLGPEPVMKWVHFGFCLGLEESSEFAYELLKTLRGRRGDCKVLITKRELQNYWHRLTNPCFHSRLQILFDLCDRDMDGRIDEKDIRQAILLSSATNKISLKHQETQNYGALVMEFLDTKAQGYIEPHQLPTLFKQVSPPPYGNIHNHASGKLPKTPICKKSAEIKIRSQWRRAWIIILWLLICFTLFTWKFIQYRHRAAFEVMGYCLCTAKGAAETLKFNMALVLLPVCRNTITWLRRNPRVNYIVPFNDNINFHKVIAGGIVIGVILHGGTHLACDLPRISSSNHTIFRQTIASRFGYRQPTYIQIICTTEVTTGIAMVVIMSIAFLLATRWSRKKEIPIRLHKSVGGLIGYNTFWYSHHLLIIVYALLIVHSMFLFLTSRLIEKTTWLYIAFPVLLYAGERIFRAVRSSSYDVGILKATIHPGKVLSFKLQKPQDFKYKSGMYIFLQCPQISPFQWHPFSLTSGPEDDHLSVHIRTLGDWSSQIYTLFQEKVASKASENPKLYIDGPYGAASQDHVKYDIVMLIGLGIGATPFISVLKDIATCLHDKTFTCRDNCGQRYIKKKTPSKAYFYWVTREQSSFDWFGDTFREISKASQKQEAVEMHNFLTSVYQEGDARSALISAIQELYFALNGIDILSWTQVRTHFGRPKWHNIFTKLATRHKEQRIGVFYCGPITLARELKDLCAKFSTDTTTRFVFHKENY